MIDNFRYDVFISYSSKDRTIVRLLAEQLFKDGLHIWYDEWEIQPGDSIPAKIEEGLENSRILLLCLSNNAYGSDWSQLESGTFRFRDPLNKNRRFIPLRLDATPIKGSLIQFSYINWIPGKQEYDKLLKACQQSTPFNNIDHTKLYLNSDSLFIQYFAKFENIQIINNNATKTSTDLYQTIERLIFRIELCTIHPKSAIADMPISKYEDEYFIRLCRSLKELEPDNKEATELLQCSSTSTCPIGLWEESVKKYCKSIGGLRLSQQTLQNLGQNAAPVICLFFNKMNNAEGHNSANGEYHYCWMAELALADILARMQYFPSLSFLSSALQNEHKLFRNDFSIGITRIIRRFGASNQLIDQAFIQLVGISATEILRSMDHQ